MNTPDIESLRYYLTTPHDNLTAKDIRQIHRPSGLWITELQQLLDLLDLPISLDEDTEPEPGPANTPDH